MGLHYCLKKIKKCDPKRLQVTRHARHDKTFPCCYFLQRDTKTNWLNLPLDGDALSGGVCLWWRCPAPPHRMRSRSDPLTHMHWLESKFNRNKLSPHILQTKCIDLQVAWVVKMSYLLGIWDWDHHCTLCSKQTAQTGYSLNSRN